MEKQKIKMISIIFLYVLLIVSFLFMYLPQKEPTAASNTRMYLSEYKSLNFKTVSEGTKECWVFGESKNNTYGTFPAAYCLNLGKKANNGEFIKEITSKIQEKASAALRWGYQKNESTGENKIQEDERNKNLLKYVYKMDCTEREFRYATQLAVWMILDSKNSLHGYKPANEKNKLYVLAKKIVAKAKGDIGKDKEDVGPRAIKTINPTKMDLIEEKGKLRTDAYYYETSIYGYPYHISVVKELGSEDKEFYEGEFPKGFQIKSSAGTFTAATKWNMAQGDRKKANKERLEAFIKKTLKSSAKESGKLKKGTPFYLYVDKDANLEELEKIAKHIFVYVKGLPDPKKEKAYYYDTKVKGYQKFGRLKSVQNSSSDPIELRIKTGGAQLKVLKYPSDAKFSDGFTFDSKDAQEWSDHNNDRLDNDPDEILAQKIEEAIEQNTSTLLANSEFLQAFEEYKQAVASGDTEKQKLLSGKYRALLFYAQNDTQHDDLSEILDAYHTTLAEEVSEEFDQNGTVTEPLFKTIYEEYAVNQDKGTAQVRIDAKFLIRGAKGAFDDTKYAKSAITEGAYSYLTVKTQNGKVSITGIKEGTYLIAEQSVSLDNYRIDGFQKLYTNLGGTKKIVDSKDTKTFTYHDKTYKGSVVEVKESNTSALNYYDFVKINYPYGLLEVDKTAKKEKEEDETITCDAAFRLVGISDTSSFKMKNGAADDPLAEGGYNFVTESGYARITKLMPGEYILYEYRKGQSFTDENGTVCEMEQGYEEYDTKESSDKSKLLEVYRFTVKDKNDATSIPFAVHVENLTTPTVAFIKLDGGEYEELYKDYQAKEEVRQELLKHFEDSKSFLNKLEVSFRVTGISAGASYQEGKLFETRDNVCLVTDLQPGTYKIQEEAILSTDGAEYEVNRKSYEIELDRSHTIKNPYMIVHPNYIENPIYADLILNKMDNLSIPMSDVTFSCASYLGEYTEGYHGNELSQKNTDNRYNGKEYYAEGTVKNGSVSFENIRVEVDEDNNVTTWLHLHELVTKAGYDPVPINPDGNYWNDYAVQCPYCQKTGEENANGLDLSLHSIKAFPKAKGRKTIQVINKRNEKEEAYLSIHKTSPAGFIEIEGAEFELYTNPSLGTSEKIPMGYVTDEETGEEILTTLESDDTTTEKKNLMTDEKGQAKVKITKTWLDVCDRFKVKEVFVPEPYVIKKEETSFQLGLGDFVVLSIENDIKEGELGKIVIKKVAANEDKTSLAGAVFELYEAIQEEDGSWAIDKTAPVISGMTNADGILSFNNLILGKQYIAKEIQAPDGYEILESSKNLLLTAMKKENTDFTEVVNVEEQIQIEVTKKDAETKDVLAGAEFWVRDENNHIIAILKTDENGYAISKKLPKWDASKKHTIEEGVAPNGYELQENGGKKTIVLEEGKTLYHFDYEDKPMKGTIKIRKSSTDSGSLALFPLTDTRFEIKKYKEEEVLDTLIIKEDGYSQTSIPLPIGKYVITEVAASDGYYLDKDGDHIPDTIGYSKTIELKTNETLQVEFVNEPVTGKLEIHKVDSKDGKKAVGGVIFDLYKDDGTGNGIYIETLETDENGIAFSGLLYQGKYFYIERKAPPNYWIDETPHPFEVNQLNMGLIQSVVTNDLVELNLRVHKMDDKKKNLEGVGFTLYKEDGMPVIFSKVVDEAGNTEKVSEFFTDKEGLLVFPQKIGYGTYILKETTTPKKYKKADDIEIVIDSSTKYVEIEAIGKTVICEVINYPKIASICIVKVEKGTELPLSGVEFLLSCEENGYSQSFTTNANGEIMVMGLEVGDYVFTETKPKDGYLGTTPDGKPITGTIEVSEDGKEYYVKVENQKPEKKLGTLKVRKVDEETKEPLLGAMFHLVDENGAFISSQNTNNEGYAIFSGLMPDKTYWVEEITPPAGYTLPNEVQKSVPIKEGEIKEILFEDRKEKEEKGELIILKKGEDKQVLAGAIFLITNTITGEEIQKETGEDGRIKLEDLPLGEYKIEEIVPPKGYLLSEKVGETILLTKEQHTITIDFVNKKIPETKHSGEMWITKIDKETGKTLEGVIFAILDEDKKEVMRGITNKDGVLSFTLEEGTYYYQEIKAPDGYVLDKSYYPFAIKAGDIIKIKMENKKVTGKFIMNKVDSLSGDPIPDCTFIILDYNQKEIMRGKTDKQGICEFTLPAGVYYYQELEAPKDYILDSKLYRFEITKDNQIIHEEMKNVKKGKGEIIIIKLDEDTRIPIEGCEFVLKDVDGKELAKGVTNKNGYCSFSVDVGTYWYQEIRAVQGYVLDASSHMVSITYSGKRVQETVYNKQSEKEEETGILEIIKQDSETKEQLKGAVFAVKNEKGELIEQKETDETGKVIFTLPYGTYSYEEVKAPDGYLLENAVHIVQVTKEKIVQSIIRYNQQIKKEESTPEVEEKEPAPEKEIQLIPEKPIPEESIPDIELSTPKNGTLFIKKVDAEDKKVIPGTLIVICNEMGEVIAENRTDQEGKVSFQLPFGNYTYQEKESAKGYQLDTTPHEFELKEDRKTLSVVMTNHKSPQLWLIKEDYNTHQRIQGCKFEIYREDGKKVAEATTDKDGEIKISLEAGVYYYQEVKAANGYLLDDNKRKITIVNGQVNKFTITNVKQKINIPKTGEKVVQASEKKSCNFRFLVGSSLFLIGTIGLIFFIIRNKKKNKGKQE